VFDGLDWVEYDISTIFFDDYTTHNYCKGPCKLNTRSMKNWRFSTNISLFGKRYKTAMLTIEDHELPTVLLLVVSFWVGLGWVHIFRFAMGWVGSGRKWTHGQL